MIDYKKTSLTTNSKFHWRRYEKSMELVKKYAKGKILDIGFPSNLSEMINFEIAELINTDFDLDLEPEKLLSIEAETATAFQIFEHLLNPYQVLKNIQAKHLIGSVPINVPFQKAWRKDGDEHFHEFEIWQFNKLLDATGWRLEDYETLSAGNNFGIRPRLRFLFPKFYFFYARR